MTNDTTSAFRNLSPFENNIIIIVALLGILAGGPFVVFASDDFFQLKNVNTFVDVMRGVIPFEMNRSLASIAPERVYFYHCILIFLIPWQVLIISYITIKKGVWDIFFRRLLLAKKKDRLFCLIGFLSFAGPIICMYGAFVVEIRTADWQLDLDNLWGVLVIGWCAAVIFVYSFILSVLSWLRLPVIIKSFKSE